MSRWMTTLAALVLVLGVAACSEEKEKPEPTVDPAAAVIAAAEAVHKEYWELNVEASNSGRIDAKAFGEVARGDWLEVRLGAIARQAEDGLRRVGAPKFGPYETTVVGDSATSKVCWDESSWGARADGERLPPPPSDPVTWTATMRRAEDSWIITDLTFVDGARGVECP